MFLGLTLNDLTILLVNSLGRQDRRRARDHILPSVLRMPYYIHWTLRNKWSTTTDHQWDP